jgi:hypothetical protein
MCESARAANSFLELESSEYSFSVPKGYVTCKEVIKGVDPNISEEELLSKMESQYDVIEVYRFKRKDGEKMVPI